MDVRTRLLITPLQKTKQIPIEGFNNIRRNFYIGTKISIATSEEGINHVSKILHRTMTSIVPLPHTISIVCSFRFFEHNKFLSIFYYHFVDLEKLYLYRKNGDGIRSDKRAHADHTLPSTGFSIKFS